jgi:soluble lytic murein transglycosylase-like protein
VSFAYRREVETASAAHGLDPDVVQAVCLTESSGKTHAYRHEPAFWRRYLAPKAEWKTANPDRVSSSYGLMQIMYPVACELGYADKPEVLFVPEVGLHWGCRKLAALVKWANGNLDQALAAYNGGQGGNSKPPYRNQIYVGKVKKQLAKVRGK